MKKCLVYSITIYLFITMFIILHKPSILYDSDHNMKSWNYLRSNLLNQHNLNYNLNSPQNFICLPTLIVLISVISFYLAKNLTSDNMN